jgi:hypothetical protein
MQKSHIQQFRTTEKQKQTLSILRTKYKLNTSQFIRDAINEKLQREKDTIFKYHQEIQNYLKSDCPF